MTSASKSSERRLARLIKYGRRPAMQVSKYASDLRYAAVKIADDQVVGKQGKFFKALGDETRLKILKILEVGEMCVCEIMVSLDLTQPTASHHLGILENVGLVKARKEGKWVFFRIADPRLLRDIKDLKFP